MQATFNFQLTTNTPASWNIIIYKSLNLKITKEHSALNFLTKHETPSLPNSNCKERKRPAAMAKT